VRLAGLSRERELERLVRLDPARHAVVVAVECDAIRGVAEFFIDGAAPNQAEVAIVVEDGFQGRGIGKSLFARLERAAVRRGIRAFTGDVANDNVRMLALLRRADRPVQMRRSYGTTSFTLMLDGSLDRDVDTRAAA